MVLGKGTTLVVSHNLQKVRALVPEEIVAALRMHL